MHSDTLDSQMLGSRLEGSGKMDAGGRMLDGRNSRRETRAGKVKVRRQCVMQALALRDAYCTRMRFRQESLIVGPMRGTTRMRVCQGAQAMPDPCKYPTTTRLAREEHHKLLLIVKCRRE